MKKIIEDILKAGLFILLVFAIWPLL